MGHRSPTLALWHPRVYYEILVMVCGQNIFADVSNDSPYSLAVRPGASNFLSLSPHFLVCKIKSLEQMSYDICFTQSQSCWVVRYLLEKFKMPTVFLYYFTWKGCVVCVHAVQGAMSFLGPPRFFLIQLYITLPLSKVLSSIAMGLWPSQFTRLLRGYLSLRLASTAVYYQAFQS